MEFIGVIVVALILLLLLASGCRYRYEIMNWIRDPSVSSSRDPNERRKRLVRMIEDAQDELNRLDESEKSE